MHNDYKFFFENWQKMGLWLIWILYDLSIQAGWRKWSAHHPDMYARRPEAVQPDWYSRRVQTVRAGDTKERLWSWETSAKPTEKRVYSTTVQHPAVVKEGHRAQPHDIQGQVRNPRWGLYHPDNYTEPSRVEPLPPLHSMEKHMWLTVIIIIHNTLFISNYFNTKILVTSCMMYSHFWRW